MGVICSSTPLGVGVHEPADVVAEEGRRVAERFVAVRDGVAERPVGGTGRGGAGGGDRSEWGFVGVSLDIASS